MSILLFIIILGALIFVHELGHFLIAKKNGIRVDEFAIGFPPRIFSVHRGGTDYSLNLIPFGGYVKIFGENPDEDSLDPNKKDSFINKSGWVQAAVLSGGVLFNIIFAWILFLIILMSGMPAIVTDDNVDQIINPQVVITSIYPDSPANSSGLEPGDIILGLSEGERVLEEENLTLSSIQEFIAGSENDLVVEISRGGQLNEIVVTPSTGILGEIKAIGISMDLIGERKLPFSAAFIESFKMTGSGLIGVGTGLWTLLTSAFVNPEILESVAGPIGIVGLVDNASQFGLANLLAFTAILSINLAVLNILPFPALDGGRLLFLGIESVTRKRIKPAIANAVNSIGFLILIGFMIIVSVSDVLKLF